MSQLTDSELAGELNARRSQPTPKETGFGDVLRGNPLLDESTPTMLLGTVFEEASRKHEGGALSQVQQVKAFCFAYPPQGFIGKLTGEVGAAPFDNT